MPTPYYQQIQAENWERLKRNPLAYGGELRNTRKGRARPRPLSNKHSLHLVLRSSKARGPWTFTHGHHEHKIVRILDRFSRKHGVHIIKKTIQRNHLHIHAELKSRRGYKRFIRAITSAITMAVTGVSRHQPGAGRGKFWDLRPFTRLCTTLAARKRLNAYLGLNQAERIMGRFNAEIELENARRRGIPSPFL